MTMRIDYAKSAIKALKKLNTDRKAQIITAIEGLTQTPPKGDIKPLTGSLGDFRLRVGDYRVIYSHRSEDGDHPYTILWVAKIETRGGVYK